MLNVNVDIDKTITHEVKTNFFSNTKIQWRRVVSANHGIKETFSTGSQNQNPPQPSSQYAQIEPSKIPNVKKNQEIKTHCLICLAQSIEILFRVVAARVEEKIIEEPT